MDDDGLRGLIGEIYDAAVDRVDWGQLLTAIGEELKSPKIALVSINTDSHAASVQLCPGWDPSDVVRYERDYAEHNPIVRDASLKPYGSVRADTLLPDYQIYRKSALFNEFFAPNDAQHLVGAFMLRAGGQGLAIAFQRGRREGPHEPEEVRLFAHLLPHIMRSFELRGRLLGAQLQRDGLKEALAAKGQAALLVTGEARVVQMNDAARRILAAGDGLCLHGKRLGASTREADQTLLRRIGWAARPRANRSPETAALRIDRRTSRRPYSVMVVPPPARDIWMDGGNGLAMVFVQDPEDLPMTQKEVLSRLFGLTAREADLAAALASGTRPKDYAACAGISENTVRWLLKRILAKTGARNQAGLVQITCTSAGASCPAEGGRPRGAGNSGGGHG